MPICTYVCTYLCALVRNPSYIYAHSYQSKVLITGLFTALSLTVVTKARKLNFWHCCECYSCECCSVLSFFGSATTMAFSDYESKGFLLSTLGRATQKSHAVWQGKDVEPWRSAFCSFFGDEEMLQDNNTTMLHFPRLVIKVTFSQECTSR